MINGIQVFNYENSDMRFGHDPDGTPWVAGLDLGKALGYVNPLKAIRDHVDPEDKGVNEMETPGGKQRIIKVYEPGIYSLIINSKLPEAKKFKRWIFSEVLPSIRKTGTYTIGQPLDKKTIRAKAREDRKGITAAYHDIGGISKPYEFKNLTDTTNKTVLGMTAKEFREANGLKKNANTRDHMSSAQLIAINTAELVTTEYIYRDLPNGYKECKEVTIQGGNVGNEVLAVINRALERK